MNLPHEVTQRDLRNRSAEIMDAVGRGESFVVTRSGTAVGELIPLRRRRTVTREEFAATSRSAPAIDLERFRDDVDSAVDAAVGDPYGR